MKARGILILLALVLLALFSLGGIALAAGDWNPAADVNSDGVVDLFDLLMVAKDYGKDSGSADPAIKNVLVRDWAYTSGKYTIVYYTNAMQTSEPMSTTASIVTSSNVTFVGADSIAGIEDKFIDVVLNQSGEAVRIIAKPYMTVMDMEQDVDLSHKALVNISSSTQVILDGSTYPLSPRAVLPSNATPGQPIQITADMIKLIFNKDNQVERIRAINYTRPALVGSVDVANKRIFAKAPPEISGIYVGIPTDLATAKTHVIFKDGKKVDLDAIKPGDLIRIRQNSNGYDYRIYLEPSSAAGVLQGVEYDNASPAKAWRLTVGGAKYEVQVNSALVSNSTLTPLVRKTLMVEGFQGMRR